MKEREEALTQAGCLPKSKIMKNSRKYYLKQKLKKYINVSTTNRQVNISDAILDKMDEKAKRYLFELRDKFGYNLQYTI